MITTETLQRLETMAAAARPINDDDWGTDRQITAQNAFFVAFDEAGLLSDEYDRYTLKADVIDMLDEAMRLAREAAGVAPPKAEPKVTWRITVTTEGARKVWCLWSTQREAWDAAIDYSRTVMRVGQILRRISVVRDDGTSEEAE